LVKAKAANKSTKFNRRKQRKKQNPERTDEAAIWIAPEIKGKTERSRGGRKE
jgi:hypothetical protein